MFTTVDAYAYLYRPKTIRSHYFLIQLNNFFFGIMAAYEYTRTDTGIKCVW